MKKNIPAQELIKGSRNIDQMEKEVNQLVSMLSSFARTHDTTLANRDEQKKTITRNRSTCRWVIDFDFSSIVAMDRKIKIECFLEENIIYSNSYSYLEKNKYMAPSRYIQTVYEDLESFVEAMFEIFPGLEERCEYLINASKIELPA